MKIPDWKTGMRVFALLAILTCACRPKEQANHPTAPATTNSTSTKSTADLIFFTNNSVADFSLIGALENGEYAKLDALAGSLRQSKAAFDNGRWKLAEFYSQLSSVAKDSPESDYLKRLKHLQKWSIQKPPSLTADIALSIAYREYAWRARGSGFANTVSPEGWRLFQDRINTAKGVLTSCKERRKECPGWWSAMQLVALAEGWDRKSYDALLAQAVEQEPTYVSFYHNAFTYLLPRWHGAEGECEKFIAAMADKAGGEEGDILYAQIVWRMQEQHVYGNIFKESKASWPRTQKGFEAMRRRHPESLNVLSAYCSLAGWGSGRLLMRQLFDELGDRVDLSVWDTEAFLKAREFTYPNGRPPRTLAGR
jgi:hypothetical protein